jgi:hypothetical protein
MKDSNPPAVPTADASMDDMLRIMDVATALRHQRETAEAQLDVATAKVRLRERLLATAAAAGEPVTAAEVDAAIEEYFRRQHEYRDPPRSWARFWAHVWVMRRSLLLAFAVLAIATVGIVGVGAVGRELVWEGPGAAESRPEAGVFDPAHGAEADTGRGA